MCDAILKVPPGIPLPTLRGMIRRYFDQNYGTRYVVFLFMPSQTRCYARIISLLPRERNSSIIRKVVRTYEYDIILENVERIVEVPA